MFWTHEQTIQTNQRVWNMCGTTHDMTILRFLFDMTKIVCLFALSSIVRVNYGFLIGNHVVLSAIDC